MIGFISLCGTTLKLGISVPALANQEREPPQGQVKPAMLGREGHSLEEANSLSVNVSRTSSG